MAAVLDLCHTEDGAGEILVGHRVILDHGDAGLAGVGENKLRVFIAVDLDDTLGIIDKVSIGSLQFSHTVSAWFQIGDIHLAVLIGDILLGEGAAHMLDAEAGIGQRLQRGAVQLHQMDAGFLIVEEEKLQNAIGAFQLDLLGIGIDDMGGVGCDFLDQIGAGVQVSQQDLAELIGLENAKGLGIPEHLEGDVGHCRMGLGIILDDAKTGLLLVDDGYLHGIAGEDGGVVDLITHDVACGGCDLRDAVSAGFDLVEYGHASVVGFAGVDCARLDMLNADSSTRKLHTGVGELPHQQIAVGGILKGHGGLSAILHLDILGRLLTEQIAVGGFTLIHGIISGQGQRDDDLALGVGGKGADRCAFGVDHLEQRATQRDGGAFLILDDLQAGLGGDLLGGIGIVAVRGQSQRCGGVGVHHVVLQVAVLVRLSAHCVVDGVLIDIGTEAQLNAAGLPLNGACGIQDFELTGVALSGGLGGDDVDLPVVHVHDLGPRGNSGGIGEGHIDGVVTHPGVRGDGEDLLQILLTIDGGGIGHFLVRLHGHIGRQDGAPCGTAAIDVLCRSQHLVGPFQLHTGEVRVDLQIVDVPMTQQIAPQSHLRGVIRLILVFQLQLAKAAMGISVGDDAHDLGVCANFFSQILDAFALGNCLRHTFGVGIHTIGGDLLGVAVPVHIVVIGVDQLTDPAVDGQVTQLLATVIDVHFAERFLDRVSGGGDAGEHSQQHDDREKHRKDSLFHCFTYLQFD